ncbi:UDP-N-acetylglucosamine 1-carboxyvinyltransferase [Candidatus Berkelbacteria bacterium]|nr:UDP-N-acetylglucosamine 1-carboxyvinyltransferase [Candidatus Berkelbacteria bacterium]
MPDKVRITGGKPLKGQVTLAGGKNTVSKIMVATLLSAEPSVIENVPDIEDVEIVSQMIEALGGTVTKEDKKLTIQTPEITLPRDEDLLIYGKRSRIPPLFCGPMLARTKKATIPMPGGCNIGNRPINFHIEALKALGAQIEEQPESYHLTVKESLKGAKIELPYPSVGSTEQVLLSSVLADGVTELTNAAVEPEIIDLIAVLQKMGAIIAVDTDRVITITGVKKLGGYTHQPIPDRLEAASWACAAALTNGRIFVRGANQLHMMTFLNSYRQIGGGFDITDDGITFYRENHELHSISLETDVYPGFSTDYQQPFVVVLTQAKGTSVIHETVYEERFGYVDSLNKMGAQIQLYNNCLGGRECRYAGTSYLHSASITGPTKLHGANITVPDLRAGFSYVIAALAAVGESEIDNFSLLSRGYENLVEKLRSLGAEIQEI